MFSLWIIVFLLRCHISTNRPKWDFWEISQKCPNFTKIQLLRKWSYEAGIWLIMTAGTPKTQKKLVWGGYHNLSDLPGPICDFSRFFRAFQPRTQILKKTSSWTSESEKNVWKWIFSNSVPKFQKYDTWAPFWYIYIGHAPSRSKITIFWNPIVHFSGLIGLSLFWKPLIFEFRGHFFACFTGL